MAQFNIDIPGVGTITVDGNFATEDSINRLAASMRRGSTADPFDDFRDSIDDTADSLNLFDPAVRRNKKSVDDNTKSLNRFQDGFSRVDGLFSDMGDPGSGTLTKLVKTVGEAGAGLGQGILSLIPVIGDGLGSIFSNLTGIFTGLAAEAIGFATGLVDINKDINNAGIGFITGIRGMQDAAMEAGVPFQQFSKAMIENTDSLRLMAGGAPGGILNVSKALNKIVKGTDGSFQTLLAMGYTVEDIMGTMTDLGAQAGLVGQSLNPEELANGTKEYLKSQQELNRLTGIDIKQARERMKEQNASLFIQRQLNRITDPQQRSAANDLLARVPDAFKDFVASGTSFTQTSGIITSQLPLLTGGFRKLYEGVESGAIKQEQVDDYLAEILKNPALEEEMNMLVEKFGIAPAELFKNLPIDVMEDLRMRYTKAFQAADSETNYNEFVLQGMNKTVASMEELILKVNNGFSTLGFTLFSFVDGYLGKAGDAAGNVVDRFTGINDALIDYNEARQLRIEAEEAGNTELLRDLTIKEREAKDKLTKMSGDMVSDTGNLIKEIPGMIANFTKEALALFEKLKDPLSEAIYEGFDKVAEALVPGYMGRSQARQELEEKIPELKEQLSKAEQGEEISPDARLDRIIQSLGKEAIDRLASEGIKAESYDPFGALSAETFRLYKQEMIGPTKPPGLALGGIFDYKPGGEVIRVAEASDEIVAPAKRGADGKLGLEVSGAMLDNSRLLQSLVKVNEAQASMISGLTSQMASMNSNFEKLVYEQRQANRLAV